MMKLVTLLDQRFLKGGDPAIVPLLRMIYGMLVLIHLSTLWPNAELWFTDQGVLNTRAAHALLNGNQWSILFWLPSTTLVVQCCLSIMFIHAILLVVGIASRLQATCLFLWLISFQNRNFLILDGEDTLMRLYAFFLIWLPLDERFSITSAVRKKKQTPSKERPPWALRLFQFQIIALYASTALCKLQGDTWHAGTAMWYVSKMTDNYGRLIPATLFDYYAVSAFATWSALLLELTLPIALLIPRTRKWGMVAGLMLHLGIEVSMNLFLFQWFMIFGLLSFFRREDWSWLTERAAAKWFNRKPVLVPDIQTSP